jgi:hypothetical protein
MYYVYIYLDPRKKSKYIFGDYIFNYEPIYVGKGKGYQDTSHFRYSRKKSKIKGMKQIILRELFENNLKPIIIRVLSNISEEEAFDWECEYIKSIGRLCDKSGPLTNLTNGGEGLKSIFITEEHLINQSKRSKHNNYAKGLHHTEETKKKISESNKGLKRSEKTKNLVRLSKIGKKRIFTNVWKNNISKSRIGKKQSEETKKKISVKNKGRKMTSDNIKKMLISKGKIYIFIDPKGIIYSDVVNVKDFCIIHNLNISTIYDFLNGRTKKMKSGWKCFKK